MSPNKEARAWFEPSFSEGAAARVYRTRIGDVEAAYPWDSLRPERYPEELVERARVGWTENAFNEHATAVALGQLVETWGKAQVPLDLWSMAAGFIEEEILHVELCSRVAMALGGGAPLVFHPEDVVVPPSKELSPLERANELAVRLLCVGETMSLPMLTGCMEAASHPLTKQVLRTIVKDEAQHGHLGWLYLDWVEDLLTDEERGRLARVAESALEEQAPIWERLRSRVSGDGPHTSEGFLLAHVHELGWMDSESYHRRATIAVEREVISRLSSYGIAPRRRPTIGFGGLSD